MWQSSALHNDVMLNRRKVGFKVPLEQRLATQVQIRHRPSDGAGAITIAYYSVEEGRRSSQLPIRARRAQRRDNRCRSPGTSGSVTAIRGT